MKKIIVLLALAIATLASSAYSADDPKWKNLGAAPFARSLSEAFQKSPAAIDSFQWKQEFKEHFKAVIADTVTYRPTVIWITPGMPIEEMWSGKDSRHSSAYVMRNRTMAELSVFRSPDGRPYPKDSVFETAKALSWTWTSEGDTQIFCIPFVCLNLCRLLGTPPPERCVELSFNAPVGGFVRWGFAGDSSLLASACNAQRQGDEGLWLAWYGKCDNCIRTPAMDLFLRDILGDKAEIHHKYLYKVTDRRQIIRFSTDVWTGVVYICLEYPDGSRTIGVYVVDWEKQYEVEIQDDSWVIAK